MPDGHMSGGGAKVLHVDGADVRRQTSEGKRPAVVYRGTVVRRCR